MKRLKDTVIVLAIASLLAGWLIGGRRIPQPISSSKSENKPPDIRPDNSTEPSAESPQPKHEIAHWSVPELLGAIKSENESDELEKYQFSLIHKASPRTVALLVFEYHAAQSDETRRRLAETMGMMRNDAILPSMVVLLNDAGLGLDHSLCRAALRVLARTGTPFAVEALAKRLTSASSSEQDILVSVVGSINAGSAVHELIHLALGERPDLASGPVRRAATSALRNYPISLCRPALETLSHDSDKTVSEAARGVLAAQL